MNETQVSIRVPADFVKRAEKLVPKLRKDPEYATWRISRAAVLRLAVARGLDALEEQFGTKPKGNSRR